MDVARAEAASELYEELETVEGQKKIYRIAKYRNKVTKDISHVKHMKDGSGAVLQNEERARERWKDYFENLLNEEYPKEKHQNETPNQGLTIGVTRAEVETALKKMKKNKATGQDEIPVEAWRVLGGEGVDLLWDLMIKIEEQEHMPDEWRESVLVPIYKEKVDVQECQNYGGIKHLSHTMCYKMSQILIFNKLIWFNSNYFITSVSCFVEGLKSTQDTQSWTNSQWMQYKINIIYISQIIK